MVFKGWSSLRFFGAAALAAALVSGCGGGSSGTASTPTLGGVAAIGVPIVAGSINVTCTGGSAQTTTSTTGSWTVSTSGLTLPCAVRVTGGTVGGSPNTTAYHSVALSIGTVNVTPLTDVVVAQMLGSSPATWFATPVFTNVNSTALTAALNSVSTSLGINTTLGSVNPLTASFVAQNGDKIDDVLEAMKSALTNLSKTYADLLAAAQANNYTAVNGFGTAFTTSYASLAGSGSGSASCTGGATSLVFSADPNGSSTYTNGQSVCFTASTSALSFSTKTLGTPVQNTGVSSPISAYKFTDPADSYEYEVVFKSGNLYEINLYVSSKFSGQFAAPTSSGATAGSLTVQTSFSTFGLLTTSPAVNIPSAPKPADETAFCNDVKSDDSYTSLSTLAGFTLDSCSYIGNVGTISATVTTGNIAIPYTVTYTYN